MSPVSLSWSTAEVKKSKLTVALEGDIPKGWKQSFETTVALLGRGEWGEVQVKKAKVEVSDVEPGSEDKLRHHLEAIVAQANANHEPDESEESEESDGASGSDDEDAGPDSEMAGRFRSFGENEDEDGDEHQDGGKSGS
jgi:hypothetical protein